MQPSLKEIVYTSQCKFWCINDLETCVNFSKFINNYIMPLKMKKFEKVDFLILKSRKSITVDLRAHIFTNILSFSFIAKFTFRGSKLEY